jgi:hypothetical protein
MHFTRLLSNTEQTPALVSMCTCWPQTLLYPSGCGIALHAQKMKKQELVPLADKGKHLTAIGEQCDQGSML